VTTLALLWADREAGFNDVSSHLAALGYYLSREYSLEEAENPRFVPGRAAAIVFAGRRIGQMGEVHPAVLANWGISMPCAALELDLGALLGV
jgi:phenylalanyl-tRNA synthetase beta chain